VKAMASGGNLNMQAQSQKEGELLFGPRPVQGLIKGKIEEAEGIMNAAARN